MAGMDISKLTSAEILTALQNGEITPEKVQGFSKSEQVALTQGLAGKSDAVLGDNLIIEHQPEQVFDRTNEQDSPIQPPPRTERYDRGRNYEIMEFDENGKRIKSTIYDKDGVSYCIREFDENGISYTETQWKPDNPIDRTVSKYDRYGRCVEKTYDCKYSEESYTLVETYFTNMDVPNITYDEHGLPKQRYDGVCNNSTFYSKAGIKTRSVVVNTDKRRRRISCDVTFYNPDGSIKNTYHFPYKNLDWDLLESGDEEAVRLASTK